MLTGLSIAWRLFMLAPTLLIMACAHVFAAGTSFTQARAVPLTVLPAVAAAEKTATPGKASADKKTLTFDQKTIRLIVHTGPGSDMLSYRVNGLRNPTLVVPRGAMLKVLFINTDDDMFHNIRFGAWRASWPNDASALLKSSVGTPPLPHKSEKSLHAEDLTLRVPTGPGIYAYFCTVRGHAQGGMVGTVEVK